MHALELDQGSRLNQGTGSRNPGHRRTRARRQWTRALRNTAIGGALDQGTHDWWWLVWLRAAAVMAGVAQGGGSGSVRRQ